MQLSNLLGMYHNTTSQPTPVSSQMGTQKLVSSLAELEQGNIFEGTVNSIKNGKVELGLSNGQTLTARLDASVQLTQGQSLFFQVKLNDGQTIAIRPFTVNGNQVNLTMLNALSQANLSIDESNMQMVNVMMEKAMPVDRESLTQMARLVSNNPTANVETLVEMTNLKIPTTPEMISQFQNYANDKQAITNELNQFMDELPNALSNDSLPTSQLANIARDVIHILTEGLATENVNTQDTTVASMPNLQDGTANPSLNANPTEVINADVNPQDAPVLSNSTAGYTPNEVPTAVTVEGGAVLATEGEEATIQQNAHMQNVLVEESAESQSQAASSAPGSLGTLFNTNQLSNLTNNLYQANLLPNNQTLEPEMNAVALMQNIAEGLSNLSDADRSSLMKLFKSVEFKNLTKEAMQQQWLLKPQDLQGQESNQISKLYSHLKNQLNRIESAVSATGQDASSIHQMASEIRNNVDFMNQVNQTYQYVQIPLQMNGQNVAGELYVFKNKRNIEDGDELSAFLHLDMEHLGSTDVSVKMKDRKVDTKFYFDNDASYNLIMEHSDELAARLQRKGYQCSIQVVNEAKHLDFVEDFMKQDAKPVGLVHRYSFDMRA